jgi:hypothetical protein
MPTTLTASKPVTLRALRSSGWRSRSVKAELRENLTRALAAGEELFPGIVGYDATVIPEVVHAVLAGHDMLFLGEKGQGKSRLMRQLVRFLDAELPYLDIPGSPVHEDPYRPITAEGRRSWPSTGTMRRSPGGPGRTGTPSGSRPGPSSRTSSGRLTPASSPGACRWTTRVRCSSA